jgi:hypothetical protein
MTPEVSPQQESVIQMADRICEAVLGPTEYRMVALMNSVADQLSDRGMAIAVDQPQLASHLLIAACEIGLAAEKLDRALIDKMAAWFDAEAN